MLGALEAHGQSPQREDQLLKSLLQSSSVDTHDLVCLIIGDRKLLHRNV